MKRAVVTGGSGFIGSHIVDNLLASDFEVLVIDDLSTGNEDNLSEAKANHSDRLKIERVDICDEAAAKAIEEFKPETVFHLAAQMNVRLSVDDPCFDARSNVVGTANMLDASQKAGVKRFIFSSTGGAIYGEQDYFPADENHATKPKCPYGVSKRSGELYLEYYAAHFDMACVSLRFANVYGPRQNPKGEAGVVAIFSEKILNSTPLMVNGDGGQTRDFVYVDDVVQACMLASAVEQSSGYSVFNVGLGIETSVNDIVNGLTDHWKVLAPSLGKEGTAEVSHGPELAGEQRRSVITAASLSESLGWSPTAELGEGLARTLESFVSRD